VTPEETLEKTYEAIRRKVEIDRLDAVEAASPQFFDIGINAVSSFEIKRMEGDDFSEK
jgi:hypothetical protein